MFTGIIEDIGEITAVDRDGGNIHFTIHSKISNQLKVDQSVAHDGVCLTVVNVKGNSHTVTAINETLLRSNLGSWQVGYKVNLERCMPANGRFDGHIVQGHVDSVGTCTKVIEDDGSWRFYFSYEPGDNRMTVEKGSITINGVSLTVVDSGLSEFSVAIIPYTYEHTGFKNFEVGSRVNLEFDIVGKYVAEMLKRQQAI
jgi:riboflavin synthase